MKVNGRTIARSGLDKSNVLRRASTRTAGRYDPEVMAALELIHRRACEGISSADVVASFRCSRRMAEMRFRQIVAHSILDEIQTVRLERARESEGRVRGRVPSNPSR
ncbi:MAG: hypothetical protein K6G91_12845 [Kiritimatiellae bacterium]|nr:hypothetical protein [Kiritimatiellia bacterium]